MDSKRLTAERLAYIIEWRQSEELLEGPMVDELLADRAALEQRVVELEAALRPFAKMAGMPSYDVEFHWNDEHPKAAAKALADGERG